MFHSFQPLNSGQKSVQQIQLPFIKHAVVLAVPQSMPEIQFKDLAGWGKVKFIMQHLAKSFRLMVGVHDYQNYVLHMQQHHPTQTVMTEKEFHRRCLEARYPSQGGKMNKCPC